MDADTRGFRPLASDEEAIVSWLSAPLGVGDGGRRPWPGRLRGIAAGMLRIAEGVAGYPSARARAPGVVGMAGARDVGAGIRDVSMADELSS